MYEIESGECAFQDKNGITLHKSSFNLKWLKEPEVIIDVGAWDFGDSIRFKQRWPNASVYSFELSGSNFDKFSQYARSQGINTYHLGIGNKTGVASYWEAEHIHGDNAQSSFLEPSQKYKDAYSHIVQHKQQKTTPIMTIDDFCITHQIENVDLCHIDVEGFEYQVIEGFGSIRPKMVFAEFLIDGGWTGQKSFAETVELLDKMGYNCVAEFAHDKLFVLRE